MIPRQCGTRSEIGTMGDGIHRNASALRAIQIGNRRSFYLPREIVNSNSAENSQQPNSHGWHTIQYADSFVNWGRHLPKGDLCATPLRLGAYEICTFLYYEKRAVNALAFRLAVGSPLHSYYIRVCLFVILRGKLLPLNGRFIWPRSQCFQSVVRTAK